MKEIFNALVDAIRSPHGRSKIMVRTATAGQLREEVSAAVPVVLSNRRYGLVDDHLPPPFSASQYDYH